MLKKVRLRLTFFCALVIAAILLVMTAFCILITERSAHNKNYLDFQRNTTSIVSYIDGQHVLSHAWLARMEHDYNMKIDILDNGQPLLYDKLRPNTAFTDVLALARETAKTVYHVDVSVAANRVLMQQETFQFDDASGSGWYATAAILPRDNTYLDIAIIAAEALPAGQVLAQRLLFGAGALISLIVLTVFTWFFIGRMLQPVEESRLRQAQFVAAASHELRSPLSVMLSSLSAAKNASAEEQAHFFASIESEGQRMAHLISDMLALANSDNRTWSIHPAPAEADTLLLETYEKYEPEARSKNLFLSVQLPDEAIPVCIFDKERIVQTLAIFLDNTFSYTPAGGRVMLSLSCDAKYLRFSVADNGHGLTDEQKKKVFDRFYRADNAHQSKEHFGLGLCIAKEILLLHKGRIEVTDTPGGGATFTAVLPIVTQ